MNSPPLHAIKVATSRGLTGIVMVLGGNVLRLIEGKKEKVWEEYEDVKRNPNLSNIIKLFDHSSTHRYFENYVFMSDIHSILNDFSNPEMEACLEECFNIDSREMRILKDFLKNNR